METGLWFDYLGTARQKGAETDKLNLTLPRHISTLPLQDVEQKSNPLTFLSEVGWPLTATSCRTRLAALGIAKIGPLNMELDWLKKSQGSAFNRQTSLDHSP
ncbi:MAG: hypothetical protein QX198_05810 [Methylococcaceae bacterium]